MAFQRIVRVLGMKYEEVSEALLREVTSAYTDVPVISVKVSNYVIFIHVSRHVSGPSLWATLSSPIDPLCISRSDDADGYTSDYASKMRRHPVNAMATAAGCTPSHILRK
jgi:protein involved in polysaccharide export with SLBB domain